MQGTEWPVTRAEVFQGWLQEILTPQQIDGFNRDKEFDGSHAFPFVRVRINLMDSLRGPAMVLRLIPQTILTMEQLNLPSVLESLAARRRQEIFQGLTPAQKIQVARHPQRPSTLDFIQMFCDDWVVCSGTILMP